MPDNAPTITQRITDTLALFHPHGEVIEVRGIDDTRRTYSGSFTDPGAAAAAVSRISAAGVTWYFVLNQIAPACHSRLQRDRIIRDVKPTTSDPDITRRRWILIDVDAVRPTDVSATDTEKAAAREVLRTVGAFLKAEGYPEPIMCDSGNGYHLIYNTDLPNTPEARATVEAFLKTLGALFDTAAATIDKSVYNAARITKLYGCTAHKGANTPERPHRPTFITYRPPELRAVTLEQLRAVIAYAPPEPTPSRSKRSEGGGSFADSCAWFETWAADHGAPILEARDEQYARVYKVEDPFDHNHKDAAVFVYPSGALAFKCFHDSCAGRKWADYRRAYDPSYDPDNRPSGPARRATPEDDFGPSGQAPRPFTGKGRRASEFPDEQINFLWRPYIPKGEYTLLAAAGGYGKTALCCAIAAAVSSGAELLGDTAPRKPERVLIISAEDSGSTLKRRLSAGGAILDNVIIYDCIDSTGLSFSGEGYEAFAAIIKETRPALVIIDPYFAFLDSTIDLNRINQVRPVLQQLAVLAKEAGTAFILLSHVNKRAQGENLNNAATGTADIINAARSALSVQFIKDNRRVMVHTKSNHAAIGKSIEYQITEGGGVHMTGYSPIDKEFVERAARSHRSIAEMLEIQQLEEQYDPALLVEAIKALCDPSGEPTPIAYDQLRDKHGDRVFLGEAQPARALRKVSALLTFEGVTLSSIGAKISYKGQSTRGFKAAKGEPCPELRPVTAWPDQPPHRPTPEEDFGDGLEQQAFDIEADIM